MKFLRSKAAPAAASPSTPIDRRSLVVGSGVAGAAAIAAATLHRGAAAPTAPLAAAESAAGYRETAHVLRYYETTRA